jgi:hypothetical protein
VFRTYTFLKNIGTKHYLKIYNMAQEEKVFADGFSFKRRDNAPDFVVGRVSVKCDDAVAFMKQHHKNGWINLNINQAKSGSYYVELDTFVPKPKGETTETPKKEESFDLPF